VRAMLIEFGTSMNESLLEEVTNEALNRHPSLCMVVEDAYGRSRGFSWLIGRPIVSKLKLEPPMNESSLGGHE
jgi:hypothetical protein